MHTAPKTNASKSLTPIWLRALNWLARRDANYRAARMLRAMPEERLNDMGISRAEANVAFYRRGSRKADSTVPTKLTAFRVG